MIAGVNVDNFSKERGFIHIFIKSLYERLKGLLDGFEALSAEVKQKVDVGAIDGFTRQLECGKAIITQEYKMFDRSHPNVGELYHFHRIIMLWDLFITYFRRLKSKELLSVLNEDCGVRASKGLCIGLG
ncbi:MAG: hypothetical protein ACTSRA_17795 [Promethearchaeota archaeon]